MPAYIDITNEVEMGAPDGEDAPMLKCACGERYPNWEFILSEYPDMPGECDACGRKMFCSILVKVYEIPDG